MDRTIKAPQGVLRMLIIALATKSPVTGKEIIEKIKENSHGKWTPSPGSVYYIIDKLLNEELLMLMPHSQEKRYIATSKGIETLKNDSIKLRESITWSILVLSMLADYVEPNEGKRMKLLLRIANLPEDKIEQLISIAN